MAKTNNELPEEEEDEEDSHFKVDKYMPGDFEYDPKGIVAPGLLKKSDTLAPFPRANLDKEDIEFRDHMTAALEAIPHTFIKDFDKDYQLS